MPEGSFTGVDLENVTMTNSPSEINLNFGHGDLPYATEAERRDWQSRQIAELRNALLGDDRYGVHGLVDTVRNQRVWLIILTVAMGAGLLLLLYQQFQIHQILQRLG